MSVEISYHPEFVIVYVLLAVIAWGLLAVGLWVIL